MQLIKKAETNTVTPSWSTTIREYLMDERAISGAVTEITGRYPEEGFAINELCKELVYILSGSGAIVTQSGEMTFAPGDIIFIDKDELHHDKKICYS